MGNIPINQATLRLVIAGEVQQDISFPLIADGEVTLGRELNCDIPLETYISVSRRHAVIRSLSTKAGEWVINDLNSANGTFINGQKIQGERVLKSGDKIQLAQDGAEFLFEYDEQIASRKIPQKQQVIDEDKYRLEFLNQQLIIESNNIQYIFDLDVGRLITRYQTPIGWLFGMKRDGRMQYPLEKITSVKLKISRNDNYDIFLMSGELISPISPLSLRNNLQKAKQLVDFIARYLQQYRQQNQENNQYNDDDIFPIQLSIVSNDQIYRFDFHYGLLFTDNLNKNYISLRDVAAVSIEKSIYEEDGGGGYDTYNIYLKQKNGSSLRLNLSWNNNRQPAEEVANLIQEYLEQI